jgi:hypothetical protein
MDFYSLNDGSDILQDREIDNPITFELQALTKPDLRRISNLTN